jgi:hypothetical protein
MRMIIIFTGIAALPDPRGGGKSLYQASSGGRGVAAYASIPATAFPPQIAAYALVEI